MPPATRRLKATQPSQPASQLFRLFCACDVLLVKAMQRAIHLGWAIDLAQDRCWQGQLQK